MPTDDQLTQSQLTQKYNHYHQHWSKEIRYRDSIRAAYDDNGIPRTELVKYEYRKSQQRARYYNKMMCQLEALNIAQGQPIGVLTWNAIVNNPNTGLGAMYQDD